MECDSYFAELQKTFPNLNRQALFMEGSLIHSYSVMYEEIQDLLALAELYGFEDRVFSLDVHGSLPVMYVDVGAKDPEIPNGGRVVKRIYSEDTIFDGKPYLSIWGEGWDPKTLNPQMETKDIGMGNFSIVTIN